MDRRSATARVPATSANLGPGFDCLGVAVRLHNTVTVRTAAKPVQLPPIIQTLTDAYFEQAGLDPFPFAVTIRGKVPSSRGLGSSVTVRLGALAALNEVADRRLEPEELLDLVIEAEGHPDNAVPAMYGGFAACTADRFAHASVGPDLHFVALIPELEMPTDAARRILAPRVTRAAAISNMQHTALITAAFAAGNYAGLEGLFVDRLHQDARAKFLPCLPVVIAAAEEAGALGAYLSGAGSTIMALTLQNPGRIKRAMLTAAEKAGVKANCLTLAADNDGLRVTSRA